MKPINPTPLSLTSTLPSEHAWVNLQLRFDAWQEGGLSSGPHCLVELFAASQLWIEHSLSGIGQRHHLIGDLGQLLPGFQRAVSELQKLPDSSQVFAIWMDSLALRLLKLEAQESVVPIQIPNAAWHGFRRRFNALPSDARLQLLQCLPPCEAVPFLPDLPQLPNGNWLVLWQEVTEGVPQEFFPQPWRRHLREHAPAAIAEVQGQNLILPSCGATPQRRIILPSRKFEKELGRIFHQAAAWAESKFESEAPLILPDWVIPKSPTLFLQSIEDVIARNGGMPTEASLREPLGKLVRRVRLAGEEGIASLSPLELRKVADDLEAGMCDGNSLISLHYRRRGDFALSELALQRALSHSLSRKDLASVLANMAGIKAGEFNLDEAEQLLLEALQINPWSRLARKNLAILRRFLQGEVADNHDEVG